MKNIDGFSHYIKTSGTPKVKNSHRFDHIGRERWLQRNKEDAERAPDAATATGGSMRVRHERKPAK